MLFGSHAGNDVIPKMFDVLEQVLVRGTGRDNPKYSNSVARQKPSCDLPDGIGRSCVTLSLRRS